MTKIYMLLMITLPFMFSCSSNQENSDQVKLRGLADTVGFAHLDWQTDSVMNRILRLQAAELQNALPDPDVRWKVVISPHDDYTYVGYLYPAALKNLKAKTIILFGVAHKARKLGLENQVVFDSFEYWHGPYGNIPVSALRDEIINRLEDSLYQINDEMAGIEHSLEALLPFIQYYNREIEIIPILVPYMPFTKMEQIAGPLARSIAAVMREHGLSWGEDFALAISTDAVHYGDVEWGDKNFAFYGSDTDGYQKAVAHEHEIIDQCLTGELKSAKIEKFTRYTLKQQNFREYKWTWCGRYSVPLGLLTAFYLEEPFETRINGNLIGYANSIDHTHIPVNDLRMGITANAQLHHWVGYAAVGYK